MIPKKSQYINNYLLPNLDKRIPLNKQPIAAPNGTAPVKKPKKFIKLI